jgi:hypothetical protein
MWVDQLKGPNLNCKLDKVLSKSQFVWLWRWCLRVVVLRQGKNDGGHPRR